MIDRLINALVLSKNEAADDLLLQAAQLGVEPEQRVAVDALMRRKMPASLIGLIRLYDRLPESLQHSIVQNIALFHRALADCGRSDDSALRLSAMRLIALGRQGKLAYVLSENLHSPDPALSKAASEAVVALARWVATETRQLQRTKPAQPVAVAQHEGDDHENTEAIPQDAAADGDANEAAATYERLMTERPEIEAAVARAINVHRGKHGPDLLRAALLLGDWSGSKTLAILQTPRHGGQNIMVRRLQQPPDSEHVAAFLLGSTHGQLRSHFGNVFSRIDQAPVLDALLRKTHWLKNNALRSCVHQVTRGAWWGMTELARDIDRRGAVEAAAIAEWIAVSGIHDAEQDERIQLLFDRAGREDEAVAAGERVEARMRLLRVAMSRPRGGSVQLIRSLLSDPDERIMRMAARELVRRKPPEYESILLKLMTTATPSVRRVIGRAIGQAGFEGFWQRFDRLDKPSRLQAGKVMLKLLPDAGQRLQRRALAGTPEQRIKAIQIVEELGIGEPLQHTLVQLCGDPNPRIRSKAVAALAAIPDQPGPPLVERLLNDPDPRVRANLVEVLEAHEDMQYVTILAQRAMTAGNRERANSIKAMHRMKVSTASAQLLNMLRDERPEHRISAMWALRQIGWWRLLNEVGRLAKADGNVRVRQYAIGVLKTVAELVEEQKKAAG
jgi:hypothetical protein